MSDTVTIETYPKLSFDELLPELKVEMPEVPNDMLASYVRSAAIEFAKRTNILERDICIQLLPCVRDYIIEPPDCMDLVGLIEIEGGKCWCGYEIVSYIGQYDCVRSVEFKDPHYIIFSPAPTEMRTVTITCSVVPTYDTCDLDAKLVRQYREEILHGARARLYAIGRRPWSSESKAAEERRYFEQCIASVGLERLMNKAVGAVRVKTMFHKGR